MSDCKPPEYRITAFEYRGVTYPARQVGRDMWAPVGIRYPIPPGKPFRIVTNTPFPLSAFVTKEELTNMFLELHNFGKEGNP